MILISNQIHFKTQVESSPVQDGLYATCSRKTYVKATPIAMVCTNRTLTQETVLELKIQMG